jgi:hypothetical protein
MTIVEDDERDDYIYSLINRKESSSQKSSIY